MNRDAMDTHELFLVEQPLDMPGVERRRVVDGCVEAAHYKQAGYTVYHIGELNEVKDICITLGYVNG